MASKIASAQGGIRSFVSAMLPTFEKTRLLEDFNSAVKELRITRDMYNVDTRDYMPVLDKKFGTLVSEFKKHVNTYNGDVFGTLVKIMDARLADIDKIIDYAEELYAPVIVRDLLDYQKINMLRYVDGISFFNSYARKLMLSATTLRLGDKTLVAVTDKLDYEFLNELNNTRSFAIMSSALENSYKEIRQAMDKMAKVTFSADSHEMVAKTNSVSDPMRLGFMPVVGTLVYHIGLAINLYHSKRQDLAREELEKLRIQQLLLRRKAEESTDPTEIAKLEKQMKYHNNRINKISMSLEEMAEG
jgi:hypothetical protein